MDKLNKERKQLSIASFQKQVSYFSRKGYIFANENYLIFLRPKL